MPILDAQFLDSDVAGADLLRSVFDAGRQGRRRKIADLIGLREQRAAMRARPIAIEIAEEVEDRPALLVAAAE